MQAKHGADSAHPVKVTAQIIEEVTCKTVSGSVYDLAKAILADRFEKAMRIVEDLLYLRYQPTAILAALSGAYVDLYIAKTARSMGAGRARSSRTFPTGAGTLWCATACATARSTRCRCCATPSSTWRRPTTG